MPTNANTESGSANEHCRHDRVQEQFGLQAEGFAKSLELHGEAVLKLLVDVTDPKPSDEVLDVACGPGSVVAAFAGVVRPAVGLDATEAMLEQALSLATSRNLQNVEWQLGDVYSLPFPDGAFDIVSCRFAFHHFEEPAKAFSEMARVCPRSGRIVLWDSVASADPTKAAAFNAMERYRDGPTVEFRPLSFLTDLFSGGGLPSPRITRFQNRDHFVERSFPVDGNRNNLRRMIDDLFATDAMDPGVIPDPTKIVYPSVILVATKP